MTGWVGCPISHPRRAFTLIELLVVTGLVVLLFTLVGTGLARGRSLTESARQRLAQQDEASLALARLAADLRLSARVATVVGPGQLGLQTVADWKADGTARWRNGWTVYFRDSENRLRRWVQVGTPAETTQPLRLTPGELAGLISSASGAANLCSGVEDFQLEWSGVRVLRIGLRLGPPAPSDYHLELSVRLRNGR